MPDKNDIAIKIIAENEVGDGINDIADDLDRLEKEAGGSDKALSELSGQLREINRQKIDVDGFVGLKKKSVEISAALEKAKSETKRLALEIKNTENPTQKLTRSFEKQKKQVRNLAKAQLENKQSLQSVRAGLKNAGVDTKKYGTESRKLNKELDKLTKKAKQAQNAIKNEGRAAEKAAGSHRKMATGVDSISTRLGRLQALGAGVFSASKAIDFARDLGEIADEWKNIEARLKLVTGSSEELEQVQNSLFDISQETSSSYQSTADLYAQVARNSKELGVSNQELLNLTETINKSIQISGVSGQSAEASITQLNQALASGVLRGDEFNSVVEQTPRVAEAMADGLGVPLGKLRELAEGGELTSDRVIKSLLNQKNVIDKEYAQLPDTIGRSMAKLSNEWGRFISELDKTHGVSEKAAQSIGYLADHLEEVVHIAEVAGGAVVTALGVKAILALKTFAVNAKTTRISFTADMAKVSTSAKGAATSIGLLQKSMGIFAAAAIGFEIGSYLREEFAIVRKAGVGMIEIFEKMSSAVQFYAEAAKAPFNDDTIGEAWERHKKRLKAISEITRDMYKEAEKPLDDHKKKTEELSGGVEVLARHLTDVKNIVESPILPQGLLDQINGQTNEAQKGVDGVLKALEEERKILRMTAKEQFIYNQIKKAGEGISVEQTEAIKDAAEALFNEKEAIESAQKATKKLTKQTGDYIKKTDDIGRKGSSFGVFGKSSEEAEELKEKTDEATVSIIDFLSATSQGGKDTSDAFEPKQKKALSITKEQAVAEAKEIVKVTQEVFDKNPVEVNIQMPKMPKLDPVQVSSSYSRGGDLDSGLSGVSIARQALKQGNKT